MYSFQMPRKVAVLAEDRKKESVRGNRDASKTITLTKNKEKQAPKDSLQQQAMRRQTLDANKFQGQTNSHHSLTTKVKDKVKVEQVVKE